MVAVSTHRSHRSARRASTTTRIIGVAAGLLWVLTLRTAALGAWVGAAPDRAVGLIPVPVRRSGKATGLTVPIATRSGATAIPSGCRGADRRTLTDAIGIALSRALAGCVCAGGDRQR